MAALKQSLQPLDGAERPHIAEAEGEVIWIFIANRTQSKTLVFKGDAAGCNRSRELPVPRQN
jgi:hypothetical protein